MWIVLFHSRQRSGLAAHSTFSVAIQILARPRFAVVHVIAHDGIEAFAKLRGEDGGPAITGPLLVLLDLNMPRMGGHEFLDELRRDPRLAKTLVFVLTTSNDERDRCAAYDKNIAGYLVKSEAGRDLMNHIPLLENFLLSVRFPVAEDISAGTGSCEPAIAGV